MEQLQNNQVINENRLDRSFYFQSLFQEACRTNQLSGSEIERIQIELVELMGKEIERYTNDESSSVPVEKAQEILQSITYSMGFFLKTTTDMTQKLTILKTEKVVALFHKGMEAVSACRTKAEGLLKELQRNCLKLDNISYQDTIAGLSDFFHDYNIEFGAHEIPASIDYPVCQTMTELLGVEYIYEYLKCITTEDFFLKHFQIDTINSLMQSYDREARHLLFNVFELVLTNAIGCSLLGQKITGLDITEKDLAWLQENLYKLDRKELEHKMTHALMDLSQEISLEPEAFDYAKSAIPRLAAVLTNNLTTGTLDKFFLSIRKSSVSEEIYEDGIPMEDEQLRALIEQLKECRSTAEKIELLKAQVSSMADFTELMEECFYEEEYDEVFDSLNKQEKVLLSRILKIEAGLEFGDDYDPLKLWQKKFLRLGNTK